MKLCAQGIKEDLLKSWLQIGSFFPLMAFLSNMEAKSLSTQFSHGLIVELKDPILNSSFKIINLYGLYVDNIPFWEGIVNVGLCAG
jgi:hypothetical protein